MGEARGGKVCVTGGRNYMGRAQVNAALAAESPGVVIQGGCPTGADKFAREWAMMRGTGLVTVHAAWKEHGRAAGPMRNRKMLDLAPRLLLAFPGGRGTADCVAAARERGIPVKEIADDQ